MSKLTQLQELDAAIRLAASDAEASLSSREVAETFYSENRKLIETVADAWIVEKLTTLIGKERAILRLVADGQFVMEFAIGLTSLPKWVTVRGKRIERSEMTLMQARSWVVALRKTQKTKKSKTLVQAELMVELMERHSESDRGAGGTRLKWAEVRDIEAAAVAKNAGADGRAAAKKK